MLARAERAHFLRDDSFVVLSHAPYGYQYVRRTDTEPASYQVLLHEANVVRQVFRLIHPLKSPREVRGGIRAPAGPRRTLS
jgi:hypothetical protein